jgi:hypothetical protein
MIKLLKSGNFGLNCRETVKFTTGETVDNLDNKKEKILIDAGWAEEVTENPVEKAEPKETEAPKKKKKKSKGDK